MTSEILGWLVNTLSANYEYSRSIRENLLLPNQIKLSKKPERFCCNVLNFLESKLNFEGFEKKLG